MRTFDLPEYLAKTQLSPWYGLALIIGTIVLASLNLAFTYKTANRTNIQLVFAYIWLASALLLLVSRNLQSFEFVFVVSTVSLGFSIANAIQVNREQPEGGTDTTYAFLWIITSAVALFLSPLADFMPR